MKKLLAAMIGALVLVSGLSVGSAPAQSAEPYPGTITTALAVSYKARVHRGRIQRVQAEVVTSGNVTATGTVTISITRVKTGKTFTAVRPYSGSVATYLSPRLKKRGLWTLRVVYTPTANSVYKAAEYQRYFKVKKRRFI